ncbi:4-alpha-glucanotransferase [Desulfurivibrio sp. D14AmB]|uniref:4-alpha-glucanotransferase n=1 Tax=Desulfurivibrio sp. D14AmB TaxID=3374370 RepID=UPI00376EE3A1
MIISGRGSGILLHLSSLPSRFGIGDLGPAARAFVDLLAEAGQQYWQFLPLCPTSRELDNSPYMGLSAFAGNPLLISPECLVEDGLLPYDLLHEAPQFSEYLVAFDEVLPWKEEILAAAFAHFIAGHPLRSEYARFIAAESWLDDYVLFVALHEEQHGLPWYSWPSGLARRLPGALAAARQRLAQRLDYHRFVQFIFFRQWERLRRYAGERGVRLIGDLPIYLAPDSAEVWAWPQLFLLDEETMRPTHVAGVPPDYFSDLGQRWGNPLFRWDGGPEVRAVLEEWWQRRLRHQFRLTDLVRIDHFRGFESYWRVPASEPDAVRGEWVKGPGLDFFRRLEKALGPLPIIAEDLGLITPAVEELRDALGFPGMKVLQFAFDSDERNSYLPHNYAERNCVVYTGTHDNDTAVGWYFSDRSEPAAKERLLRYARSREGSPIHWDFIRLALASVAALAIIPLQDLLGFGSDCRMNIPGTDRGNWRWRVAPRFLSAELMARLRNETEFYNRLPRRDQAATEEE